MKHTLKLIYNTVTTILVLETMLLALLLVGVRLLGFTPYSVLSGSMEPAYPVGSLIYVKALKPQEVQIGDPITFVLNEDLVVATHRVVDIDAENEQFYTKGDANDSPDAAPVHFKNLLGKPMFHMPCLGYVANFLSTQKGMTVGGCALVCIILLLFFPDILRWIDKKENKEHKEHDTDVSSNEGGGI